MASNLRFHDYVEAVNVIRRARPQHAKRSRDDLYEALAVSSRIANTREWAGGIVFFKYMAECRWVRARRPFYNVWPAILPMLLKLDLSKIPCEAIDPVMPELLLRLPIRAEAGDYELRTVLVTAAKISEHDHKATLSDQFRSMIAEDWAEAFYPGGGRWQFLFNVDYGEPDKPASLQSGIHVPRTGLVSLHVKEGADLQTQLDQTRNRYEDAGEALDYSFIGDAVRLYCTLCLLDQDSELLSNIVLNKDRIKYEETGDDKYVAKAAKRGVIGWDVGRELETVPHFRRPHFGIRYMRIEGHEELQPRVRPIKGSLVHREKLKEVPTGYLDDIEKGNHAAQTQKRADSAGGS